MRVVVTALSWVGALRMSASTISSREGGASLDDLGQATCWQPYTCRAVLTGLRKKGGVVAKIQREDGVTIYRISSLQAAA